MIRLLRWCFRRRSLDDILSKFEDMQVELDQFSDRTEREIAEQRLEIERLQLVYKTKLADQNRARVVAANIETLLTRQLGPDHCEENV